MKRLITIAGLVLSFACQPFASERTALARVTVYWPGEGSGKSAAWNGARLREDHCAVDPKKIPYGSKVIFGDSECVAVDTGPDVVNRKRPPYLQTKLRAGTKRGSTIHDRFIIPLTATLTNSCVISGARTSQPTIPIRPRLRTTGFTTLMSR